MPQWFTNLVSACLGCLRYYVRMYRNDDDDGDEVALMWSKDFERHSRGDFSFAVIQANEAMEDYSQVEIGSDAIFVGVYDGHGGQAAAHFVRENLFQNLINSVRRSRTITEETLRAAVFDTDAAFLADVVENNFRATPKIAAMGSCCLIGVIWNGTLHIANVGDSTAVIGSIGRCRMIVAEQLTREHNVKHEEIRQELINSHPNDPHIVVQSRGAWRVRGIIQVSRTMGDAYLKDPRYALDDSYPRFHLAVPITRPVVTAEPSLRSRPLQPNDRFIIFASDGLWEHLTNQEAVEIVHRNPRNGSAKKLIKAALKVAAKKRDVEYEELQQIEPGNRRVFHDDISVIVIFLDHGQRVAVPELSYKANHPTQPSAFTSIHNLM